MFAELEKQELERNIGELRADSSHQPIGCVGNIKTCLPK
jgi:hypothetical protein